MKKGRFAPSPSGRMHLGNVFTALLSWLSVKKEDGKWVLRIEDLDPQRSKLEYAKQIEDDLNWLGLIWDEGGLEGKGENGPYQQSLCCDFYEEALKQLEERGLTYPCKCKRADIMATQAPHQADGRVVYAGTCRPTSGMPFAKTFEKGKAERLYVPDQEICFTDRLWGPQRVNLASLCGDFVVRRADGAFAYQLAVVVDDMRIGITEVMRGYDLLLSAAQQIYIFQLLGVQAPEYAHVPLIGNREGQRLSKRDHSMSMEHLRDSLTANEIIGKLAYLANIISQPEPISAQSLLEYVKTQEWHKPQDMPQMLIV